MDVTNYTSGRKSENVTLDEASNLMNEIATAGLSGGKPLALFGNQIGGARLMTPVTSTQNNGSATWVDGGPSLTDQGINPADDRLYFQLWIEAKQHYVCVGDVIRELKNNGNNLALAIA